MADLDRLSEFRTAYREIVPNYEPDDVVNLALALLGRGWSAAYLQTVLDETEVAQATLLKETKDQIEAKSMPALSDILLKYVITLQEAGVADQTIIDYLEAELPAWDELVNINFSLADVVESTHSQPE